MKLQLTTEESNICKINNQKFPNKFKNKFLLENYGITYEQYLIKYYLNNVIPVCKCGCGTHTKIKFYNNTILVPDYTKNHWPHKRHTNETIEKIKLNTKKSILNKYGVDNIFRLDSIKDKIKNTNLKKYGNVSPMKNDVIKNKCHHYHTDDTIQKIKSTNNKKYGANSFTQSEMGKKIIKNKFIEKYGVDNPMKVDDIKNKLFTSNIKKIGYKTNFMDTNYRKKYNNKHSKIEIDICNKLNGEHKFIYKNKEFDIKVNDNVIEIDGNWYHPNKIKNLTFTQLNNVTNDNIKNKLIKDSKYNFYRIYTSDLPNDINLKNIIEKSYKQHFDINIYDNIILKEYLKKYLEIKGPKKLESNIKNILKFIREFFPEFPELYPRENLNDVIEYIKKFDYSKFINSSIIYNNINNIGNNYLKSNFKSYWKSRFYKKISPYDAWYSDDILYKIIKYRIGLNNSGEVFDFSINQILRGLSANRYTVSFFKPIVAAIIYKKFLNGMENPVVIDPCAGFGARMLAFKSLYPNGYYIGIEPNPETFIELELLSKNFNGGIELHNCKLENYTGNKIANLTFTSVPYYNNEIYSNGYNMNLDEWKYMMYILINNYNNVLINISEKSYKLLNFNYNKKFLFVNNASHFNKKTNYKTELLLQI